jgi:hypothetical protein
MIKALGEVMAPDGRSLADGRVVDHLVYTEFVRWIDDRLKRLFEKDQIGLTITVGDGGERAWRRFARFVCFEGQIRGDDGVRSVCLSLNERLVPTAPESAFRTEFDTAPVNIAAIADRVKWFLINGFVDQRLANFPSDARVTFFPSYNATGEQMPVTITFLPKDGHVEFVRTEGDRLLPSPPEGTFVYIETEDGRELRGRVNAAEINTGKNGFQELVVAVTEWKPPR